MSAMWPHQQHGVTETLARIDAGVRGVCLTSPTGGGKTRMMVEMILDRVGRGQSVSVYSVRRMLTEQLVRNLTDAGIRCGVRAAGFEQYADADAPVQVCSTPTVYARAIRSMKRLCLDQNRLAMAGRVHHADTVFWDEPHMQKATMAVSVMRAHTGQGASHVGLTATPIGLSHLFPELVVAGNNTDCRQCGAHVPCLVKAPSELDAKGLKPAVTGEFNHRDIVKKVWTPQIFGHVVSGWREYNPDGKPAILFAPGVAESLWFVEQFRSQGIEAAHIDGEDVFLDGKRYAADPEARQAVVDRLKSGDIKVICNRFVMREGIDIPELYHCILATPIGSLLSYVQTTGRVLRSHPSMDHVVVQDHGGNWWRHGSPNADRDWRSVYTLPVHAATELRAERCREGKEDPGLVCPACGSVQRIPRNGFCYSCAADIRKPRSRFVIQKDGRLKAMDNTAFAPLKVRVMPDTESKWRQTYHRMKRAGKTFRQAYGLFQHEHHYAPPKTLRLMPQSETDWFRKIGDVPTERLR